MSLSRLHTLPMTITALLVVAACGATAATPTGVSTSRPTAATSAPVASPAAATSSPSSTAASSPSPTNTARATRNPSAGYTDLKGWLVFEHFGQAPDGSTDNFDFDNRMIWMVHADGSGLHELAPGKPVDGKSSPDISPDGTIVAFSSWTRGQLWTVPIDGSADPMLVTTGCRGGAGDCRDVEPAWSADGQSLAFVHFSVDGPAYSEIAIRNQGDQATRYLDVTRTSGDVGYVSQPSWSPDGRDIVYYVADQRPDQEHPTGTKVMVAATDGSSVRELPHPTGSAWAADPDWSPDGRLIVFGTVPNRETEGWGDFPGRDLGLWTVSPDGTNLKNVCGHCLKTPVGDAGCSVPSWTADGRILCWGYKTWALMNADGSDAAHINMAKLTWNGDGLGFNYAAFLQPTP